MAFFNSSILSDAELTNFERWQRHPAHLLARTKSADSEWLKMAGQALEGLCAGQGPKMAFPKVFNSRRCVLARRER